MTKGELRIEKRRHERLDLSFPVVYHCMREGKKEGGRAAGRAGNISEGGIKLVSGELIGEGAVLQLEITLPGKLAPVTGTAKVVWAKETAGEAEPRECQHGLKFIALDGDGQDMVTCFMVENLKRMSGMR